MATVSVTSEEPELSVLFVSDVAESAAAAVVVEVAEFVSDAAVEELLPEELPQAASVDAVIKAAKVIAICFFIVLFSSAYCYMVCNI